MQRDITIFTRGKSKTRKPMNSEKSFSALSLECPNINLKNKTGKQKEVQNSLQQCHKFQSWIKNVVECIENKNYEVIDIFCNRGKHRSVACAELLKKHYYPNARIIHLNI